MLFVLISFVENIYILSSFNCICTFFCIYKKKILLGFLTGFNLIRVFMAYLFFFLCFQPPMSCLKWVSCRQHIFDSCFIIHSDNLSIISFISRPFALMQILTCFRCTSILLLLVFCLFFCFSFHCFPSCFLLDNLIFFQHSMLLCLLVSFFQWLLLELQYTDIFNYHNLFTTFGEGNDKPLQYSCLENPTDGEAWRAMSVGHKSRTSLSD